MITQILNVHRLLVFFETIEKNKLALVFSNIIILFIGYLIGSIMFSLIIGKYFYKKDIRKLGSKSAGGTNAIRHLGVKTGTIVIFLDVFKGAAGFGLAVILKRYIHFFSGTYVLLAGLGAAIGHCFPLYFNFKGGKGAAISGGAFLLFNPYFFIVVLSSWWILQIVFHYVSLATILGMVLGFGLTFTVLGKNMFESSDNQLINSGITFILFGFVILMHWKNIQRLINGTEPKSKVWLFFEKKFLSK